MMVEQTKDSSELKVEARSDSGKGVARKLRKAGKIPGVFYGSRQEPVGLLTDPKELVEALSTPKLKNTLIKMVSESKELDGKTVMVKEIQKHPLTRQFLHVDLMEVYADVMVRAEVPITVHGNAKGVEMGGTLDQHMRDVRIRCTADRIPAEIVIDVTDLDIGDSISLSALPFGEGVEVLDELHNAVVSVAAPRVIETAAEAAEGEEGAEGAEGAEGEKKEGASESGDKDKDKDKDKGKE